MRAERMITALLLMQARGRITAGELAAELEVSVATARRDLEALATAGVPVFPQPGRGGGWSLVGGARTDLTGLTAGEARALFTLLGPSASGSPETTSALRKLLRALPGPFRGDAQAAADAVLREDAGWGEQPAEPPPVVGVVQQAIINRTRIVIDYTRRDGEQHTATLSPLGLVAKDRQWYLIAATDAANVRTYRLDRVHTVEVTDLPAERPDGFDLAREWRRVEAYVERQRSLVRATVQVHRNHLWVLRDHFGRYLDLVADLDEDRVEITVAAHTARSLAEQLAGWGGAITVTRPDTVRSELARIGAELAASYPV